MDVDSEFVPLWQKAAKRVVWNAIHTLQQDLEGFVGYHEDNMKESDIIAVCAEAEKAKELLQVLYSGMP